MTTPYERARAVLQTEKFLLGVAQNPELSEEMQLTAKALLRHYPTKADLEMVALGWDDALLSQCPFKVGEE